MSSGCTCALCVRESKKESAPPPVVKLTIDYAMAKSLLAAAVAVRGKDYVDPRSQGGRCEYATKSVDAEDNVTYAPGCIVGQVVFMTGVIPLDVLNGISGSIHSARLTFERGGVAFTDRAKDFLGFAQARQDSGKSWGEAQRDALESTPAKHYDENETFCL